MYYNYMLLMKIKMAQMSHLLVEGLGWMMTLCHMVFFILYHLRKHCVFFCWKHVITTFKHFNYTLIETGGKKTILQLLCSRVNSLLNATKIVMGRHARQCSE